MRVELRPSSAEDIAALIGNPLAYRARLITVVVDGAPAAIGGLTFRPDGVWATAVITPKGRAAAKSLHRAALQIYADARRLGIRRIYSLLEPDVPRAQAWLERLGFRETEATVEDGRRVWVWE